MKKTIQNILPETVYQALLEQVAQLQKDKARCLFPHTTERLELFELANVEIELAKNIKETYNGTSN